MNQVFLILSNMENKFVMFIIAGVDDAVAVKL